MHPTTKELHMAEIITGPFHMDEQGFLATIEELIERFDGYSSGKYFGEGIILQHIMGGESGVGHDFVRL